MYILGIRNAGYDTSCALMKDGKIIYAICEERLSRQKRTKKFPINALLYCLRQENISIKDVTHIAISWNPGINLERMDASHSEIARFIPEYLYSVPNYLIFNLGIPPESIEQKLKFNNSELNIHYIDHHLCHAAGAYFTSNFEKAMILSMDGWGEKVSTFFATAENGKIEKCWDIEFPQSLGMFYQTMTQYLGFQPQGDEWKVMGASPYGDKMKYKDKIYKLIRPTNEGKFQMDLSYFDYMSFTKKYLFSNKMIDMLGPNRIGNNELAKRHYDIAAAVQSVFEDIIFNILNKNYKKEFENLCLCGGSAMNCVANGKVINNTNFKHVNISFAPDDAGTSIGACLWLWNQINNSNDRTIYMTPYLSKNYLDTEIVKELNAYKLKFIKVDELCKFTAQNLAEGKIIGWFQGSMEFGQRALGNRSILADPRRKEMKDLINKAVKYRESFRPFAPSILDEYGNDFFENYEFSPYMEKVFKFRDDKKNIVPSVCHVDGTGRVQSVTKDMNPLFWELLNQFKKITNIPILLNTSFNLNGEPIVYSIKDAIQTFFSCGMDLLIIGQYVIKK